MAGAREAGDTVDLNVIRPVGKIGGLDAFRRLSWSPHMARFIVVMLVFLVPRFCCGEDSALDVVDKAIRAIDPAGKLQRAKAVEWFVEWNVDGDVTGSYVFQDLDHSRHFSQGFGLSAEVVISGEQGWLKAGTDKMARRLDKNEHLIARRRAYLNLIPVILTPLKDKSFQLRLAGQENVSGKPATIVKVTAPDGQEFTLFFDEKSGLLVKMVIKKTDNKGKDELEERLFENYKETAGVQAATLIRGRNIEGYPSADLSLKKFKLLDQVEPFQTP